MFFFKSLQIYFNHYRTVLPTHPNIATPKIIHQQIDCVRRIYWLEFQTHTHKHTHVASNLNYTVSIAHYDDDDDDKINGIGSFNGNWDSASA